MCVSCPGAPHGSTGDGAAPSPEPTDPDPAGGGAGPRHDPLPSAPSPTGQKRACWEPNLWNLALVPEESRRALFSHFQDLGHRSCSGSGLPGSRGLAPGLGGPENSKCTSCFTSWEAPKQGPSPQPRGYRRHKPSFRPSLPCLRGEGLGERGLVRSCRERGFLGGDDFLRGAPRGSIGGRERVNVFLGEGARPAGLGGLEPSQAGQGCMAQIR